MRKVKVEIQQDLIEKLAKAAPHQALSELIWNALDADASNVNVYKAYDKLDTLTELVVEDDGSGIKYAEAETLFKKLGGSWKSGAVKTKSRGRFLHGQEGRGRFKAFALGRVCRWNVVYEKNKELWEYTIEIFRENIREAQISDEKKSDKDHTGVTVTINELDRNFKSLEQENATQPLSENFAIYLRNYKEVKIGFDGVRIDPQSIIESEKSFSLTNVEDDSGQKYTMDLEIIEWKTKSKKIMHLCNEKGFPYAPVSERRFHSQGYDFSAYLKSKYIEKLYQENTLDIGGLDQLLNDAIEEAQEHIKAYFIEKAAKEAKGVVDGWIEEDVYPYRDQPKSQVEVVERQVFDIVAVKINSNLPEFSSAPTKSKKLSLKLLKQAVEKSPDELQLILTEVLNLPKKQQKDLADLLKDTSLTAIINASKVIADRLSFISGLETILFDPDIKKNLLERSQLHKIIADNTWIFGEGYNLSVNDQSLTEVLRKHKKLIGDKTVIDQLVKRPDGKKGIVDLMLSRRLSTFKSNEINHLIVELKAPKVPIGAAECTQIESYAFAVSKDERFRGVKSEWDFWVISDDMDDYAKEKVKQKDRPEGILYQSDRTANPNVTIWIKTWSQIIHENKSRLKFIQDQLEYQADKGEALKGLKEKYASLLEGTKVEDSIEEKITEGA
ncbi:ATP-binding protein [Marinoscillum sp.]|uniref:ATP-binding protein n=1 Tax=Marinoscillum sp. TaxID=2024838 RepID=UPI003BABBB68